MASKDSSQDNQPSPFRTRKNLQRTPPGQKPLAPPPPISSTSSQPSFIPPSDTNEPKFSAATKPIKPSRLSLLSSTVKAKLSKFKHSNDSENSSNETIFQKRRLSTSPNTENPLEKRWLGSQNRKSSYQSNSNNEDANDEEEHQTIPILDKSNDACVLQSQIKELKATIELKNCEIDTLKVTNQVSQSKIEELISELEELRKENVREKPDCQMRDIDMYEDKSLRLDAELEQMRSLNQKLESEMRDIKAANQSFCLENNQAKNVNSNLSAEIRVLKEKNETEMVNTQKVISNLRTQCQDYQKETEKLMKMSEVTPKESHTNKS